MSMLRLPNHRIDRRSGVSAALVAAGAAVMLLAPLFLFTNGFQLDQARLACYFAILACTWSLLAGVAGQFSFAHVALAGLAGYAGAIWSRDLGGPLAEPPWSVLFGALFAFVLGLTLGAIVHRLRGAYLALLTIAFAEIARLVIVAESDFTGGDLSLPTASLSSSTTVDYYVVLLALFGILAAIYALLRTRVGLYLRAMREQDGAAAALGVNITAVRLLAFGFTSMALGLGASLYFHTAGRMVPANLDLIIMSQVVAYTVIGGLESPLAAAVSAIAMALLLENLRHVTLGGGEAAVLGILLGGGGLVAAARVWRGARPGRVIRALAVALPPLAAGVWLAASGGLDVQLGIWRLALFGAILVVTLRVAPNGVLTPLIAHLSGHDRARRATVAPRDEGEATTAEAPVTVPEVTG
jgi:branched-chain amino acid transport system permease protein